MGHDSVPPGSDNHEGKAGRGRQRTEGSAQRCDGVGEAFAAGSACSERRGGLLEEARRRDCGGRLADRGGRAGWCRVRRLGRCWCGAGIAGGRGGRGIERMREKKKGI
jgi:hypothetical protein